MTIDAVFVDVVFLGVDARYAFTLAGGVRQQRVTAQTLLATSVNDKKFWLVWMIKCGAVAIFAGNDPMQILGSNIYDVVVTFCAVFMHFLLARIAVLERLIFPEFLIGFVVIAVHETVFTRAKIIRNVKRPEQQECGDNANDHE